MGKAADVVKDVYAAFGRGDVPAVLGAFDATIEWTEAEGFVYADGNPYVGPQAVAAGVFGRIIADVDNFAIRPVNIIDGGDTVVSEGDTPGPAAPPGHHSTRSSPTCGRCATARSCVSSSTPTPASGRKPLAVSAEGGSHAVGR